MYIKDGKKFHNELYYKRWVASQEAKIDYSAFKKDELIAKAEELGVEVSSSMTKAEIIEALEA